MFPLRRYQRVSQHTDSEEEEEDVILYAHSKLMGESEFGSGEYDQGMDLSLPRIKALKPSYRRPHSWIHSLLAVCLFLVFLGLVLAIAIAAIVIGQQWSNFKEDSWESSSCVQPPPPTLVPIPLPSTPVPVVLPPSPTPAPPNLGSEPPSLSSTSETSLSSSDLRSNVTSPSSNPPPPTSEPTSEASSSEPLTDTETPSPSEPLTDTEGPSPSEPLTDTEGPSPSEPLTDTEGPSPSEPLTDTEGPSPSEPLTDTEGPSHSGPSPSEQPTYTEIFSSSRPLMDTETTKPMTSETLSPTDVPPSSPLLFPPLPAQSNTPTSPPAPSSPSPPFSPSPPPTSNTTISWERSFFPAATESTVQLYDMNQDGILDVLAVNGYSQCAVRIVALDGLNGSTVWEKEVDFESFAVKCELDVDSDGIMDCLAMGRYSGFVALSGLDGRMLWVVDPSASFPRYNFYFPLIVPDLDGDGVDDLINMHGGDSTYKSSETKRSPAFLLTISGKTGQKLMDRLLTPDGRESYMSPVLFSFADGTEVILFGSGGETLPGSLWAVTLSSIQANVREYINSSEYADYQVLRNYTNYPCSAELSYDEIEALRPVFDPNAYNLNLTDLDYPPFAFCTRRGDLRPIWNMYGLCMYELVHSDDKGVILPPVIVDMTGDGFDDLVVSTFDGRTMVLDGRDASIVWELFLPGTETYSLPAPLFFNEDATPDLLVRVNKGTWMIYDYSYVAILDGRDGRELWALNSTLTGMMSGLSLASDTHGWDAAVFLSVGSDPNDGSDYPWESNSTVSDSSGMEQRLNVSENDLELGPKNFSDTANTDGDQILESPAGTEEGGQNLLPPEGSTKLRAPRHSSKQECTRVYFEGPGSKVCPWYEWLVDGEGGALVREKRHGDGDDDDDEEEEEEGSGEGRDVVVDYSHDFIQNSLKMNDPPGLWVSTATDPFPDPTTDLGAFLRYCGYSREHAMGLLYLVTREMLDGEENIVPLATHDPFVYLPSPPTHPGEQLPAVTPPPSAQPTSPTFTSDAPPTTTEAPLTTSEAPPTRSKRHGPGMDASDSDGWKSYDYKHSRCRHIEAPSLIPSTPAIGDLNRDGRLEIAYVILWGSLNADTFIMPPKLLIRTLTLEDRFVEVYGKGVVDFSRFLPVRQQPWTRYMGTHGNNVFRVPRHRGHM